MNFGKANSPKLELFCWHQNSSCTMSWRQVIPKAACIKFYRIHNFGISLIFSCSTFIQTDFISIVKFKKKKTCITKSQISVYYRLIYQGYQWLDYILQKHYNCNYQYIPEVIFKAIGETWRSHFVSKWLKGKIRNTQSF